MKRIKDPVHGYIPVEEKFVDNIIDHAHFQRLRYIKQLTSTYMVYPAANHSRFEHTIGVYHLANLAFENLRDDSEFRSYDSIEELKDSVLSAALLHDVGHPPMSHIGETLLDRERLKEILEEEGFGDRIREAETLGQDILENEAKHELLSCVIILREFSEGLEAIGVNPKEVCSHIFGLSIEGEVNDVWQRKVGAELISSPMDVDRLDYIKRDDHMTGANVANVDAERMVESYTTADSSLVLSDKALSAIRNYLEGRIALYMWVNQHHKVVYADELLKEAVVSLAEEDGQDVISTDRILDNGINDTYIIERLRDWSERKPGTRTARLFKRFQSRSFLASCWKHRLDYEKTLGDTVADFDENVSTNIDEVAETIRDDLSLERDVLWIATSKVPEYKPAELRRIYIKRGDNDKQSVHDLGLYKHPEMIEETPYVYTTEENRERVIDYIR